MLLKSAVFVASAMEYQNVGYDLTSILVTLVFNYTCVLSYIGV